MFNINQNKRENMEYSSHQQRVDEDQGSRPQAILLVGPTGSGKSPLGDYLEQVGFGGTRCRHLDFGSLLRDVSAGAGGPGSLTEQDVLFVKKVLNEGALLENDTFFIAELMINHFLSQQNMGDDGIVVLNGIPRHVAQAHDVDRILSVKYVLYLDCSPEVVLQRIRLNSGGDRTGRIDDAPERVTRKLQLFENRTIPLLKHYQSRGISVSRIAVGPRTAPEQMLNHLDPSTFG
jgi:adenylate kinase family enzyme